MTRWIIDGTLTAESPLHVGSGAVCHHWKLVNESMPVDVAACLKTASGKPYIPGSTLKGCLRSWLAGRADARIVNQLFGAWEQRPEDAAGSLEFEDAFLDSEISPPHPPSYWQETCQTGIEVSVALDRDCRAAAEEKLFYTETVPPGAKFHMVTTADDLSTDALAVILAGLDGFNDSAARICVGGDSASGRGKLKWSLCSVRRFGSGEFPAFWKAAQSGAAKWQDYAKGVVVTQGALNPLQKSLAHLYVRLNFESPFLVNDPDRRVAKDIDKTATDLNPRIDQRGKALLPAKSFRGAVRAQAERIVRTLGGHACNPAGKDRCKGIEQAKDLGALCCVCRVFGAPGWRSRLGVSDFSLRACKDEDFQQEFVAIDRFDGGGKEGAKFNAHAADRPVLDGILTLDTSRMPNWGYGLLLLTLRDLAEGDITFGLGRSKGYGVCRVLLGEQAAASPHAEFWVKKLFDQLSKIQGIVEPDKDARAWAQRAIELFRDQCAQPRGH